MQINFNAKSIKTPIVLIGLPGLGLVGKIVLDTLVNKLKAKEIGNIKGDFFPPMVFIDKKGFAKESQNEIYLYKTKTQDYVFIGGDFQPNLDSISSFSHHYIFAKEIAEFIKKIKAKEVYAFAGMNLGDSRITKNPEIFFAKNKYFIDKELSKNIKLVAENTTISGISGLILTECEKLNIPCTCFLSETSAKIYGDFESAKKTLLFTQKYFKFKFNMKEIEQEAEKISKAFKQVVKELKQVAESSKITENEVKPTYIR